MIEGGGLGVFRPEDSRPDDVQVPNGVVDIAVADEAEAVAVAKKYLSYFQGPVAGWECADQRAAAPNHPGEPAAGLRHPRGDRDPRRHRFGTGTAPTLRLGHGHRVGPHRGPPARRDRQQPARIWPARSIATAPTRPRASCSCATPSTCRCCPCATRPASWSGPEVEKTALVRHCRADVRRRRQHHACRSSLSCCARAMAWARRRWPAAASSARFHAFRGRPASSAGWAWRARSSSATARSSRRSTIRPARKKLFDEMVARMYQQGKALNSAPHFELDDVIDPVESRRWILTGLRSAPPPAPRTGKKRPHVDSW